MKIIEIKDINRKDVPIYYRRLFSGIAVMEMINKSTECRIDFSIETKPTGHKEIFLTLADSIDYPLLPLVKELKKFIDKLDGDGALPG